MAAKPSKKPSKPKRRGRIQRQFSHVKAPTRKMHHRGKKLTAAEKAAKRKAYKALKKHMTAADKKIQKMRDDVNRERREAKKGGKKSGKKVAVSSKASKSKHQFIDHNAKTMTHDDYLGEKAKGLEYGPMGHVAQQFRYRKYNKTGPESQHVKPTKTSKGKIGAGELAYNKAQNRVNYGVFGMAYNKIKYRKSKYDVV